MTDHEMIMVCAERYALGRRTYIVGVVTEYLENHIDNMTDHCKDVMIKDIENPFGDYGDECDRVDWMRLLQKLKDREE